MAQCTSESLAHWQLECTATGSGIGHHDGKLEWFNVLVLLVALRVRLALPVDSARDSELPRAGAGPSLPVRVPVPGCERVPVGGPHRD